MEERWLALSLCILFLAAGAHAASPVGYVHSDESFRLSGVAVPVEGIPVWPIVAGDDVATTSSDAILLFLDGSRVMLAPDSRVKVEAAGSKTKVSLIAGSMQFQLSQSPRVSIYSGTVSQTGSSGTVSTAAPGGSARAPSGAGRYGTQTLPPLSRSH